MDKIFDGKVALVTGGSFGIGKATAIAFAQRGAKVVIADIVEDKEQEALKGIRECGSEGKFIACDVSNNTSVKQMISQIISDYGSLDFAFNNAGIEGQPGPTHECSEENWDKILLVNLKGTWLCMRHEIPVMLRQGKGIIVNCSSVGGLIGYTNFPAYVSSKHAIIGLTKTAAMENAKTGIRINAVCPGVIHTAMIDRITGNDPELMKQYVSMEPVGRLGEPFEVAEAVVWLCSDSASFVTGSAMLVDGAMIAGK